jgi:hypothetical protein
VSDLVQKIVRHVGDLVELHLRPDLLADAIRGVLDDHAEFPEGWCVTCGRDFPCVTLQHVGAALGVSVEGKD